MALKTFKPYTKSTRGTILVDRAGLWKGKPFKSLVSKKNAMRGRNNNGHITSINISGGHKKMYRHVDFYRKFNKRTWKEVFLKWIKYIYLIKFYLHW